MMIYKTSRGAFRRDSGNEKMHTRQLNQSFINGENHASRSDEICKRYLNWLDARGGNTHTLRAYGKALEDFAMVLEKLGVSILDAGEVELSKYVLYMRGDRVKGLPWRARLSPATIKLRITVVKQLYSYLHRSKLIEDNPGRYFDDHLDNSFESTWIPQEGEWLRLLQELKSETLRDRLMAVMAYDGALRRSTLVNLERRDVDLKRQLMFVRAENSKGHKGETRVALSDLGCQLYKCYLAFLLTLPLEGDPKKAKIFRSNSNRNRGQPVTVSTWNKVIAKVAKRAGLPQFTPHTFRHLRLTHMAEAGFDLLTIQKYAGHQSVQSTERYIHLSNDLALKVAQNEQLKRRQAAFLGLGEDS